MSTSLQLYRDLVPAHGSVPDATVEVWLELAAGAHTPAALGSRYVEACVYWAAAQLEPLVQGGQFPAGEGCAPAAPVKPADVQDVESTTWWTRYLRLVETRAAGAPRWVAPWP